MKIIKLSASNLMRLSAVEIEPDGNTVVISGKNTAGKTTVLNAIALALGGAPAAKGITRPVRDGEEDAEVVVDLGDIVVTRTWSSEGRTTLKVTNGQGAVYNSPQSLLDGLVGKLSFDPLAFASLKPKEQVVQLLDLIDLPFDPDELDAERQELYDERTVVNRQAKALRAQIDAMPVPPEGLPTEEVSPAAIIAEYDAAQAEIARNAEHRQHLANIRMRMERAAQAVTDLESQLRAAQIELATLTRAQEDQAAVVEGLVDPDTTGFTEQLRDHETVNAAVRKAAERTKLLDQHDLYHATSDDLTDSIAAIDKRRSDALAEADMPIDGLDFSADGLSYQGVPFAQASAAEQLRVSLAMAAALNPDIRVIRATDASLLDSESMQLVAEMAEAKDMQVWLEIVEDEPTDVGFHIVDGTVAAIDGAAV